MASDRLRKKIRQFGDTKNTVQKKSGNALNRKAWVLISQVKAVLKEEVGLPEIWFKNNYWEKRQLELAVEMVKERKPEFWVDVLVWCLDHPRDPFANRVRNLKPLINYVNYYLAEKRDSKHRDNGEVSKDSRFHRDRIKDKIRKKY